jgi:hypothetical protein
MRPLSTSDQVIEANLDVAGCRGAKQPVRPRVANLHLSLLMGKTFSSDPPTETRAVAKHRSRRSPLTRKLSKLPKALILQLRRKMTSIELNPHTLIPPRDSKWSTPRNA